MYTPPHNRQDDPEQVFAFMREFPFATLVTCGERGMTATHLPLVVSLSGDALRITGHLARANAQAADLAAGCEALAIFSAPHAYVSPGNYEPGAWVPTWNYVAVHAYGTPIVSEGRAEKLRALVALVGDTEPGFQATFDGYPPEFVDAKLKGIVAFDIPVSRIDARWKLSQDRTPDERERATLAMRLSDDPSANRLAQFMDDAGARVAAR